MRCSLEVAPREGPVPGLPLKACGAAGRPAAPQDDRLALFLAGDDAEAKAVVARLIDEIRPVQSATVPPNKGIPGWFRAPMMMPWPVPSPARQISALQSG